MTEVWVVHYDVAYEFGNVVAVCATRAIAERIADEHVRMHDMRPFVKTENESGCEWDDGCHTYSVSKWEVDAE